MPSYLKNDVVLLRYPFSDLSGTKVRPAVVVNAPHVSQDVFVVPLTSRLTPLLEGEFVLAQWQTEGLNVPTAVKRGLYTVHQSLAAKAVGRLLEEDAHHLELALRGWLGLL